MIKIENKKLEVIKYNKKMTSYRRYIFNDLASVILSKTKAGWVLREKGGFRVVISDKNDLLELHRIFNTNSN